MRTIIAYAMLAAFAYAVYRLVVYYRAATGTPWERLLATAKGSATILVQLLTVAGASAMSSASFLAEVFNRPEVKTFIQGSLQPEYVGAAMAGIAILTVWARLRTL